MNGIEIIVLILAIVLMVVGVGYYMNYGQPTLREMEEDFNKNEEVKEVVELAKELYNKDLRPIVAKKAPKEVKKEVAEVTEHPIKKKRKYYPKKKKQGDN